MPSNRKVQLATPPLAAESLIQPPRVFRRAHHVIPPLHDRSRDALDTFNALGFQQLAVAQPRAVHEVAGLDAGEAQEKLVVGEFFGELVEVGVEGDGGEFGARPFAGGGADGGWVGVGEEAVVGGERGRGVLACVGQVLEPAGFDVGEEAADAVARGGFGPEEPVEFFLGDEVDAA